jgi:hypothetical protein
MKKHQVTVVVVKEGKLPDQILRLVLSKIIAAEKQDKAKAFEEKLRVGIKPPNLHDEMTDTPEATLVTIKDGEAVTNSEKISRFFRIPHCEIKNMIENLLDAALEMGVKEMEGLFNRASETGCYELNQNAFSFVTASFMACHNEKLNKFYADFEAANQKLAAEKLERDRELFEGWYVARYNKDLPGRALSTRSITYLRNGDIYCGKKTYSNDYLTGAWEGYKAALLIPHA